MTIIDHFMQPGADYKLISSGTSNRSVSIVSGYKISAPILIVPTNTKENIDHVSPLQRLEDSLKRSSRYPVIPGLPLKPKLRRQGHVKKHSNEEIPEEEIIIAGSPIQMTPDRDSFLSFTPTQAKPRASPLTPAWARPTQPQRYPSSIFEDYYKEPISAVDSPIHTVEEIAAERDHDAWGRYWDDKMDGHQDPDAKRPVIQRAGTLEVSQLLKSRRVHAADFRQDSLRSLREEDEL